MKLRSRRALAGTLAAVVAATVVVLVPATAEAAPRHPNRSPGVHARVYDTPLGDCRFVKARGERRATVRCEAGEPFTLRPLRSEDAQGGYWLGAGVNRGAGLKYFDVEGVLYPLRKIRWS